MQVNLSNLAIEATRRCNMSCDHCLRGDAQPIDLDLSAAKELLAQVEYIGTITFSGGEPSLVPHILESVLSLCKELGVSVGNFYIATNGLAISEEFVITCLRWYAFCDDNEITAVEVSNDYWHAVESRYNTELLDGLSFFRRRQAEEAAPFTLIKQGRAEEGRELTPDPLEYDPDSNQLESLLYLSATGDLINGCDWSYDTQPQNRICAASELSTYLSTLEV